MVLWILIGCLFVRNSRTQLYCKEHSPRVESFCNTFCELMGVKGGGEVKKGQLVGIYSPSNHLGMLLGLRLVNYLSGLGES